MSLKFKNSRKILLSCGLVGMALFVGAAGLGSPAPSFAQYKEAKISEDFRAVEQQQSISIEAMMASATNSGKIYKRNLKDRRALKAFYQDRDFRPHWVDERGVTRNARKLIQTLSDSWTHGLNPYQYHYAEIAKLTQDPTVEELKALEILLSDAFIRYAHDMTGMRVDANLFKLRREDWRDNYTAPKSLAILASSRDFDDVLEDLEPRGRTYKTLRREFIRLVQEDAQSKEPSIKVSFNGLMRPGWSHKEILNLRYRLGAPIPDTNKYVYDDVLAAKVIQFQRENGLNADGVVGPNTLQIMNRTTKDKIHQLAANMERLRWARPNTAEKFVMVNVPSATLWAVEDGRVEIEMPVIVGRPERETRIFATEIQGMRFNPDWTVPPTIKRYDIWPKVQEDPNYLIDKGIELLSGFGRDAMTLDPASIDWNDLSPSDLHAIRMVQIPGDHNALGRYRVLMPNNYNIYLHDTNKPEYFEKTERALSSGCMRMKYPEKMAKFIMRNKEGWSDKKTQNTLESMKVTDVRIERPIPVQITYYTVWLDDRGRIVYGHDIYGHDKKLVNALSKLDAFRIPVHHETVDAKSSSHMRLVSYN